MSLRLRIVLLVLLATLTPAALLGLYLFENRKAEIVKARLSLNALAAYAAEDLGSKVSGTVQLLHGLSRAPELGAADKGACSVFLGEILARYPQYTGLLTIRPDGQLHCDSLRSGRTLDLNDRGYFKQARTSAAPAFEAVFGRLTGVAVMQIAYPARDAGDQLKYVLLASLNLARFGERFATASPHAELEVLIWDEHGTVIVRHPDNGPRKLAGASQAQTPLYRFVRTAQPGETAELPGPDGSTKIWALGVLPTAAGRDLRITLGIPRHVLLAGADRDLRQALSLLAGASLLAFLGALLFAELAIRRHVTRIAAVAARQGAGDFSARIGAPYPRGELGGLMATLDAAAAVVQQQRVETERKSAELARSNRTLRMLSAINSVIVRVRDRNELLAEACRIAAQEGEFAIAWAGLLDAATRQVEPVAWQGVDRAFVRAEPRSAADPTGLIGRALAERQAVVVEAGDDGSPAGAAVSPAARALGARAVAAFPLIVSGAVAGVLVLHARQAGFFAPHEMKLLGELAGDVAFALEYIEKSEKADYLAHFDPVTGLANRAMFRERLDMALAQAGRERTPLGLVLMDIERFRNINETLGRSAGDELLRQVAARASSLAADPRRLARVGLDHFAYMIVDLAEVDDIGQRIEQVHRELFGKPFLLGAAELRVSARFGVTLFPADAGDADTLLGKAEAALKKAKAGGERYLFYIPQMTERVAEQLSLENKLRLALERQEFVLHYQPKVDARSGRIAGVEALIRWQSPEMGLVPPLKFIPLLEETGLILQVGAWALRRAVLDQREWRAAGVNPPRVAVNVSPIQLHQRDFVRELELAIGHNDGDAAAPAGIDMEITESLAMEDIDANIGTLKQVRALGLDIAIDDFGTGHSSLAYLSRLPVQALKIDRSFVITMLGNPDTMMLVSTIISLAHSLKLTVIAEGVDSNPQAQTLRDLGCDQMQGYLFSRPVPKAELLRLLQLENAAPPAALPAGAPA